MINKKKLVVPMLALFLSGGVIADQGSADAVATQIKQLCSDLNFDCKTSESYAKFATLKSDLENVKSAIDAVDNGEGFEQFGCDEYGVYPDGGDIYEREEKIETGIQQLQEKVLVELKRQESKEQKEREKADKLKAKQEKAAAAEKAKQEKAAAAEKAKQEKAAADQAAKANCFNSSEECGRYFDNVSASEGGDLEAIKKLSSMKGLTKAAENFPATVVLAYAYNNEKSLGKLAPARSPWGTAVRSALSSLEFEAGIEEANYLAIVNSIIEDISSGLEE